MKISFIASVLLLSAFAAAAQPDSTHIPKLTGPHAVGTLGYEWIDMNRQVTYPSGITGNRIIGVQFWYPAQTSEGAKLSPYHTYSTDYRHVKTNSYVRAPFSSSVNKAPLIIICPGRGVERFGYTALAEELASQGYIVASIDMPELGYVYYQDGFVFKPSDQFRTPRGLMAGPYEKVDEFFEPANQLGTVDVLFVLQAIEKINVSDPYGILTSKIDVSNIGVFGHSLGGRIAGNVAATDSRVKILITMEGIPPRDVRYKGTLRCPSVMLVSSATYPYAKENYQSLIDNRKAPVYIIELFGFGHNSVTDFPMVTPSQFKYEVNSNRALVITRELLLDFFNANLKNSKPVSHTQGEFLITKFH